ncbi:MAG TPA: hypothetical protein VFO58_12890 [Vicinamibacterales bacterium]|nr:hypothetical protein [Vicinamibacterales bacterium]
MAGTSDASRSDGVRKPVSRQRATGIAGVGGAGEERGRQTIATAERRRTIRRALEMPVAGRSDPPR